MKQLFISIALSTLVFLCGAFTAATFDIKQWDPTGRYITAIFMGICWAGPILYNTIEGKGNFKD